MTAKMNAMLGVGALVATLMGSAQPASADAHGYTRPVNVAVLSFFLYHTYECLDGWGCTAFGGSTSGGYVDKNGTDYGDGYCMSVSGNLTYAITGVCHQGTNRGLWNTSIDWVRNWGDVKGSGASYSAFCDMGSGGPYLGSCYSAPC